ncbi:MAG: hypothetical protein HY443_00595 [Candidatus Nealsonbacteria bacterium]|nr:hypothetical protein [Candidatus Nealsonbacteria bacterium]
MRKLIIFLVVLTGISGIWGFQKWRQNIYSKEILKLEILGPTEATLGDNLEYIVKYKNNGNFRLENPELVFEPPRYAMNEGEFLERQVLGAEQLGEAIYPGQEQVFSFKMNLLGGSGDIKTLKASLSYQPKDLKARYESATTFTTTIKQVPLTLEFDIPSRIEPGQEFITRINYFSNAALPILDLRIQASYPSGFEFVSSQPRSIEKTDWEIPVLNKNQGGRIEVVGRVTGEVGSAKVFRAQLGVWKGGEFIKLKEAEKGAEVTRPSIYLRQEINGNPEYTAVPGDWLHYELFFKNIGDDALNNLFMVAKLEGEAFDFYTLRSDSGNSQAGDNSVIFDWRKIARLQYLAPMEEGRVDFWIKVKDDLGNVNNPVLRNKVFVSQVEQEFTTKIGSKLGLSQKGFFQDEVFGNGGPVPPRVGEITTYTIMWQVKNYYSNVRNVKVKAVLPTEVILSGKIFPEEASLKFSFDSESREIVWVVGDLERGTGVAETGPNIAFQIALTPGYDIRGRVAEIIREATVSGEDSWTEALIEAKAPGINTTLPDDETVTNEMGVVQ